MLGSAMISLANEVCPEHYDKFVKIYTEYHNTNCGPLHRWARKILESV
jgi:hypothetical protein